MKAIVKASSKVVEIISSPKSVTIDEINNSPKRFLCIGNDKH